MKLTRILIFLFLFCGGLYFAKGFLVPVTFGALLAMLLVPISAWLEMRGIGKALSALMCVLLFVILLSGVVALLSWQVTDLAKDIDQITDKLIKVPEQVHQYIRYTLGIPIAQQKQMIKEQVFSSAAGVRLAFIANSALSLLGKSLLILVYIFLLIYYRNHLSEFVLKFSSAENKEKTKEIMLSSGHVAQQYISGLGMMVIILWIMYGIGFSIIGVKHALFFAVLCGLLEIMPYVGNLTGTLLTAIIAFTQGGLDMVLWVILVYGVIQFTQTYILEPLVLGARVSINPLCTIVAIIVGEMIWGIPGMILAIPVLGIIKIICDNVPWLQPFGFLIGEVKQGKLLNIKSDNT